MKHSFFFLFISTLCFYSCKEASTTEFPKQIDEYTIVGSNNFLSGYQPITEKGLVNVVIEIPTGSNEKWEVEKSSGNLIWEFRDGKPRKVNYLGYPGNYGMIPQTLLPKALGGDGDPLDVLVLGKAVKRGTVLKTKIIGMLELLDRGEQDDKLIAVVEGSPFYKINSLKALDAEFSGATTIIETFFENYKGPGKMKPLGWKNESESQKILDFSIDAYKKKHQ